MAAMLGGAAFMRYYNGNTSLPDDRGNERGWGGMHMDGGGWSFETAEEAAEYRSGLQQPRLNLARSGARGGTSASMED